MLRFVSREKVLFSLWSGVYYFVGSTSRNMPRVVLTHSSFSFTFRCEVQRVTILWKYFEDCSLYSLCLIVILCKGNLGGRFKSLSAPIVNQYHVLFLQWIDKTKTHEHRIGIVCSCIYINYLVYVFVNMYQHYLLPPCLSQFQTTLLLLQQ